MYFWKCNILRRGSYLLFSLIAGQVGEFNRGVETGGKNIFVLFDCVYRKSHQTLSCLSSLRSRLPTKAVIHDVLVGEEWSPISCKLYRCALKIKPTIRAPSKLKLNCTNTRRSKTSHFQSELHFREKFFFETPSYIGKPFRFLFNSKAALEL